MFKEALPVLHNSRATEVKMRRFRCHCVELESENGMENGHIEVLQYPEMKQQVQIVIQRVRDADHRVL